MILIIFTFLFKCFTSVLSIRFIYDTLFNSFVKLNFLCYTTIKNRLILKSIYTKISYTAINLHQSELIK